MPTTKEPDLGSNGYLGAWLGAGVLVVLLFVGLASTRDRSSSGPTSNAETAACMHWSNIRSDALDGILTDDELRDKLKQVRDSASASSVQQAATHLLSAATQRDRGGVITGFAELNEACK